MLYLVRIYYIYDDSDPLLLIVSFSCMGQGKASSGTLSAWLIV